MIDPFVQFGDAGAGADDERAVQALAEAQVRLEAIRAAWDQFCAAIQDAAAAIAEMGRQFIAGIAGMVEAFKPVVGAWRRRILYARLSERLPGWLARPLVAVWPERFLPALRW